MHVSYIGYGPTFYWDWFHIERLRENKNTQNVAILRYCMTVYIGCAILDVWKVIIFDGVMLIIDKFCAILFWCELGRKRFFEKKRPDSFARFAYPDGGVSCLVQSKV
jgi:hypothetical protein